MAHQTRSKKKAANVSQDPAPQAVVTKRKRAATVGGNSSKPAPKRTAVRKNTQEIDKNGPDGSQPVSEPSLGHSYATRVTNDRHPGRTAGLEKRTQSSIEAAASLKRAMQQAKLDAKADEVAAKVFRELAGAQVVGALIARRQQEEQTHDELLLDVSSLHSVNSIDHHTAQEPDTNNLPEIEPASELDGLGQFENIELDDGDYEQLDVADDGGSSEDNAEPSASLTAKVGASRLSAKQKKTQRFNSVWTAIDAVRQSPNTSNAATRSGSGSSTKDKITASTYGGIDIGWRDRVAMSTYKAKTLSTSSRAVNHDVARQEDPDELIGGLNDNDVATARPGGRNVQVRQPQMTKVVATDTTPATATKKTQRAAKTELDPEKSLALKHMPEWIQTGFDEKDGQIVPTLVDFYGCQPNPWDLDHSTQDLFEVMLQLIIDYLYPDMQYTVMKGDKIYQRARQGLYNWRSRFQKVALGYVESRTKNLTKIQIYDLVQNAVNDGELYWENPRDGDMSPSGPFQGTCILVGMAEHLKAMQGSVLSKLHINRGDVKVDYPEGALLLTICAIHRAFGMYDTGVFVAQGVFSEANVSKIWNKHAISVSKIFVTYPHRFTRLIKKAAAYTTEKRHSPGFVSSASTAVVIEVPPSSPPPADEDDLYDSD